MFFSCSENYAVIHCKAVRSSGAIIHTYIHTYIRTLIVYTPAFVSCGFTQHEFCITFVLEPANVYSYIFWATFVAYDVLYIVGFEHYVYMCSAAKFSLLFEAYTGYGGTCIYLYEH